MRDRDRARRPSAQTAPAWSARGPIALSPDGKNAYAVDEAWGSVATLARDPADGTLRPIPGPTGCLSITPTAVSGCTDARELRRGHATSRSAPTARTSTSPPRQDDAVAILDRDRRRRPPDAVERRRRLRQRRTASSGAGKAARSTTPTSLVVSPDGKNVYVGSDGLSGGIAVFNRDPETGDLSQEPGPAGCVNASGVGLRRRPGPRWSGSSRSRSAPTASPSTRFPRPATRDALLARRRNGSADAAPGAERLHGQRGGRRLRRRDRARRAAGDRVLVGGEGENAVRRLGTARRDPGLRPQRRRPGR